MYYKKQNNPKQPLKERTIIVNLNTQQKDAVEYYGTPQIIIAAGTGKTTVMIEKIKHLIATKKTCWQEHFGLNIYKQSRKRNERTIPTNIINR